MSGSPRGRLRPLRQPIPSIGERRVALLCRNCGHPSEILRTVTVGHLVRRRRRCLRCGVRWTTFEKDAPERPGKAASDTGSVQKAGKRKSG